MNLTKATVSSANVSATAYSGSAAVGGSTDSQPVASDDIPITGSPLILSFSQCEGIAYTISAVDAFTIIIKYSRFPNVNRFFWASQSALKATGWTDVSYLSERGVQQLLALRMGRRHPAVRDDQQAKEHGYDNPDQANELGKRPRALRL